MISLCKIVKRHISLSRILAARVTQVPLPALSPTMETGSIVSWDKTEGDRLNEGDLLAEIETDKATMGFETPEEGFLAKILIPAGTKGVKLGQPLCIIVEDESDVEKYKKFSIEEAIAAAGLGAGSSPAAMPPTEASLPPATAPSQPTPQAASIPQASPLPAQIPKPSPNFGQAIAQQQQANPTIDLSRKFASPLARRLAREAGINLPAQGSGPNGRIVAGDLIDSQVSGAASTTTASSHDTLSASSSAAPSMSAASLVATPQPSISQYTDIQLTNMRQTIAKRLTQSKQEIPHYYLTVNLNVDELLKLREKSNKMLAKENGGKLSVNDFIVKAAALACKKVPQVNSSWHESFIRQFERVDVCVAVSTDSGLITPIVFGAESRGVQDISADIKRLAERARHNKLQPHEFQGGTFTISNLGMFDIDFFTAVINPPQSAILAVGKTQQTVVPSEEGENSEDNKQKFKVINTLRVTLSCDHRVVDGAVGSQWLRSFRKYIEQPYTMLL